MNDASPAAARWAVLSGLAGLFANGLLILFFALARPWAREVSEFAWLGPANDALVVVQFAALVPVALAVHARLGGRLGRSATTAAVTAMVAAVVLQLALIAGVVAFEAQVWAVLVCFVVAFGWVLAASRAGRDVLPRPAVRLGTTVGTGFLAAIALAGLGTLLPPGLGRYALWGLAGVLGMVGWLGFPVWPLLLARVPAARSMAVVR
jgi:hypothetical protein